MKISVMRAISAICRRLMGLNVAQPPTSCYFGPERVT
jgi:hypothetical protein